MRQVYWCLESDSKVVTIDKETLESWRIYEED